MEKRSDELEQLVSMAEKVSTTVDELGSKITNLKMIMMLSMIGIYISFGAVAFLYSKSNFAAQISSVLYIAIFAISVVILIISVYLSFQVSIKIKRTKKSLESERIILHHLLDMVFEYKDNLNQNELSIVEYAILDMRLKRIKFSTEW